MNITEMLRAAREKTLAAAVWHSCLELSADEAVELWLSSCVDPKVNDRGRLCTAFIVEGLLGLWKRPQHYHLLQTAQPLVAPWKGQCAAIAAATTDSPEWGTMECVKHFRDMYTYYAFLTKEGEGIKTPDKALGRALLEATYVVAVASGIVEDQLPQRDEPVWFINATF